MKNYHTHTYRCKHASGDVEDYAREALKKQMKVLGMSDHAALPDNRWLDVRMEKDELSIYVQKVREAQAEYKALKILLGMECEYAKEYHAYYKEELLDKWKFDYLILGAHYYPMNGEWRNVFKGVKSQQELKAYSDYVAAAMEAGLFLFTAHPDLFANSYELWDKETAACSKYILEAAESFHMPLEINGYGLRKPMIKTAEGSRRMYPFKPFWELAARYNIEVIVNSDAHRPEDVDANIEEGMSIAREYGLKLADFTALEKV